ncbi:hypothetical protein [Halomarina rubra]|uniref:Uncharacterized protein n=1 Tax=Halomarina rubra TaxID=2071873 RepID=A0ABD6AYT2_9EURY|nr:hypothetical protein [Halomarina rubra]
MDRRTALVGAILSGAMLFSVYVWNGGDPLFGAVSVVTLAVLTLWLN